jgi:hypothetical protein
MPLISGLRYRLRSKCLTKYEQKLSLILQIVESMQKEPQNYRQEWKLFKIKMVQAATGERKEDFDWHVQLY